MGNDGDIAQPVDLVFLHRDSLFLLNL